MSNQHIEQAIKILQRIIYANVATITKENKPWNSPVRYVYDDQLNIYWFSNKESQHSRNIRDNDDVFIVIYDSTVPEGKGIGLYIEAAAQELDEPDEIRKARSLKKGTGDTDPDNFIGKAVRRVYKAVPQHVWINDAKEKDGVFIRDYRVEISFEALRNLLQLISKNSAGKRKLA